jgi:hypothetical protein
MYATPRKARYPPPFLVSSGAAISALQRRCDSTSCSRDAVTVPLFCVPRHQSLHDRARILQVYSLSDARETGQSENKAGRIEMTFSVFAWRCSNIHGDGPFLDVFLIALGVLFAAGSFSRNFTLGRHPETSIPAPPSARIIIFLIGCLMIFQGTKSILLCR